MATKTIRGGSLRRSGRPIKDPKPQILVVCEGKITEPHYFKTFSEICANPLVAVKAFGGCGVPVSVVAQAVQELELLRRNARRSGNSFEAVFEVWAVFDRDEHPHPQVPEAIQTAKAHGIKVAYSNPCFEVWGLMHFEPYSRPGHHHDIQRQLKATLPAYCHATNPRIDALAIHQRYPDAVRNSALCQTRRAEEGNVNGNPSTTVHLLTERIRAFGRM